MCFVLSLSVFVYVSSLMMVLSLKQKSGFKMIWFLMVAGESIISKGALATLRIKSGHPRQNQSVMVVFASYDKAIFSLRCFLVL